MKQNSFLVISCCILITTICNAEPLAYYTSNLNAYVGKWEYTDNTTKFVLQLQLAEVNSKFMVGQTLVGDYTLIQNGDTLTRIGLQPTLLTETDMIVPVYANNRCFTPDCQPDDSLLYLVFRDKILQKNCSQYCYIVLLPNARIQWHIEADEGVYETIGGDMDEIDTFSVPKDCVLKKVKRKKRL